MLTVVTAATNRNLCAPAALATAIGATEAEVQVLVAEAGRAIEGHCRRVFPRDALRQVFRDVADRACLILARVPVHTDLEITEDGVELVADADFEVDRQTGLVYRLSGDVRVCWNASKVVAEFSAGFKLPEDTGRDLPEPVERACKTLVKAWWAGRDRDPMLASVSGDGVGSETYRAGNGGDGGLPDEVITLLRPFVLAV